MIHFRRSTFFLRFIISLLIGINLVQAPLLAEDKQENDVSTFLSEENQNNDVIEQHKSGPSLFKNPLLISAGILVTAGALFGINHFWKKSTTQQETGPQGLSTSDATTHTPDTTTNQPTTQQNLRAPDTTMRAPDTTMRAPDTTMRTPGTTTRTPENEPNQSTKFVSLEELQAEADEAGPLSLARVNLDLYQIQAIFRLLHKDPASTVTDFSQEVFKDDLEKNPSLQALSAMVIDILKQKRPITKEKLRSLATEGISALQIMAENYKQDQLKMIAQAGPSIKSQEEYAALVAYSTAHFTVLDIFHSLSPKQWVNIVERSLPFIDRYRKMTPQERKAVTIKQQENLIACTESIKKTFESIKTGADITNLLKGITSDIDSNRIPAMISQFVKKSLLVGEIFPEVHKGVIPSELAPLFKYFIGSLNEYINNHEFQAQLQDPENVQAGVQNITTRLDYYTTQAQAHLSSLADESSWNNVIGNVMQRVPPKGRRVVEMFSTISGRGQVKEDNDVYEE